MTINKRDNSIITFLCSLLYIPGVSRYGYRLIINLLVVLLTSLILQWVFRRLRNDKKVYLNSYLILIVPLLIPVTLPFYMIITAVIFGVTITYLMFGGIGNEIVSPFPLIWGFAALSFPDGYVDSWVYPLSEFSIFTYSPGRPLLGHPVTFIRESSITIDELLMGSAPGTPASSLPLLLIILGVILLLLRVVNFRTVLAYIVGFIVVCLVTGLLPGDLFKEILSGNFLITLFFIIPYGVLVSRTQRGTLLTGLLAGISAALIRRYSAYPDGVLFSVLIYNIFSPIIDDLVLRTEHRWRRRYV